ncbi:MAG: hypothetical protein GF364_18880 [Candidatus Lokiarchaeota archaeon]|nr:hypothetical protein [Candidatus Lokiarchaeota archaeon]
MLHNLYILRDGLPIFIKIRKDIKMHNTSNDVDMQNEDKVTMISGFFSAINSFAQTIGNFGDMREIKMNQIKFSFYRRKEKEYDSLLFVGASNIEIPHRIIEKCLDQISSKFVARFPNSIKKHWNGKTEVYKVFEQELEDIIAKRSKMFYNSQERIESDMYKESEVFKNNRDRLMNKYIANKIKLANLRDTNQKNMVFDTIKQKSYIKCSKEMFYKLIPIKKLEQDEEIYDIFSGEDSKRIFRLISGNHSVEEISSSTGIKKERVYDLCKTFIKMGLINFRK